MRLTVLVVLVGSLLAAAETQAGTRDRLLVITMTGHATATITRQQVRYEEAGSYRAVWRVRESQLRIGAHLPSSSSIVTGTTSATFPSALGGSCKGALEAVSKPLELVVTDSIVSAPAKGVTSFRVSPSPFATATSAACPAGLTAAKWRLAPPLPGASRRDVARYAARKQAWLLYNDPGFGFKGTGYRPMPKGGNSEGFGLGFGPGGSFSWVVVATVKPVPAP
jgi:hypothetical protein